MKTITINTSRDDYVKLYLRLWNGVLNLTQGELDTLEEIIKKYLTITSSGVKEPFSWELTFSTGSRKEYQSILNFTQQQFNNFFKQLRDKGIILSKDNGYSIDPRVLPVDIITFQFKIQ